MVDRVLDVHRRLTGSQILQAVGATAVAGFAGLDVLDSALPPAARAGHGLLGIAIVLVVARAVRRWTGPEGGKSRGEPR